MNKLKANLKYLGSFFKSNWEFKDYPLEIWKNTESEQKEFNYRAKFTNWWNLIAFGETKSIAIKNLKKEFEEFKKNNSKIPRPGAKVPIVFSKSDRIEKYENIAVNFFDKIIGLSYYDCFVSDLTSLHDFDLANEEILRKIKLEYRITPKNEDYFLSDIFEQINEKAID